MWGIVGHQRVLEEISSALVQGRLPHALLLHGPPNVGKMAVAMKLAQALNCAAEERPCGTCPQCRRIAQGKHADVQVLDLDREEEGSKEIGIDTVRDLQRAAGLQPYEGTHRVFIVDGAETLSAEAGNALLKTLEEPPANVVLVLLSANLADVLPTAVSRCRLYEMGPASASQVRDVLVSSHGVDEETAGELARLSRGRVGWAIMAAAGGGVLAARSTQVDEIVALAAQDYHDRLERSGKLVAGYARRRSDVLQWIEALEDWWRDLLLTKSGRTQAVINVDRLESLERMSARLYLQDIADTLRQAAAARESLRKNVNPRLAMDVLMLSLPVLPEEPVAVGS